MNRLKKTQNSLGQDDTIFDYIVIGAGVSGLQAAQILTKNEKKILLLQAQKQIGGRIGTFSIQDLEQSREVSWILNKREHFKTVKFERGATWIQLRHRMVLKIFKQFGITVKQQFGQGNSLYLANKKPFTAKQLMKNSEYGPFLTKFIQQIDELAAIYDKNVFNSKDTNSKQYKQTLKKYDSMTVQSFLEKAIPQKHVRDLVQNFLEHTQCISSKVNSMHEVLTKHARSNDIGILKQFLGQFGHQPSYLVNGGSELLIQRFIQSIQKNIKRSFENIMRTQSQVIQINNSRSDFVIVTALHQKFNIRKYKAKKIVCAVPIIVTRNITFSNLSEAKKLIFDNQLRTNAIKTFAFFKKPFWRNHCQASGDCLFSYDWALNMCHDISPEDQSCGILVFFNSGKKYDEWRRMFQGLQNQKQEKKKYVIELLTNLFNVKKGTKQHQQYFAQMFLYECSYMENPYIKSGFQSNTRPGTFSRVLQMGDTLDSFYRDQNNIIFIGSEYSKRFASYIEGAVRMTRQKIFKQINKVDPLKLTEEQENDI